MRKTKSSPDVIGTGSEALDMGQGGASSDGWAALDIIQTFNGLSRSVDVRITRSSRDERDARVAARTLTSMLENRVELP